jgi:hypothetical protein
VSRSDETPSHGIDPDTDRCTTAFLVGALAGACAWTALAIVAAYLGWLG